MSSPNNIRMPDSVYRDCLLNQEEFDFINSKEDILNIPDIPDINDAEYRYAIRCSILEQERQERQERIIKEREEREERERIMKEQEKEQEKEERTKVFASFLLKMKKTGNYDKQIMKIYNIIEPIINNYCHLQMECIHVPMDSYNELFDTLQTIRISPNVLERLKSIICAMDLN